jgi:NAD(P)-dependent dehydrogenase (short-subunit alcohol dehydrogenase family)
MAPLTWFITGCSSGFGELLVRQLRAAGDNVIATGRSAETRLAHLKDTGAAIIDLDVTAPVAEIQAKVDEAWNIYPGGIDVVVNNAGYIVSGPVEELTYVNTVLGLKSSLSWSPYMYFVVSCTSTSSSTCTCFGSKHDFFLTLFC